MGLFVPNNKAQLDDSWKRCIHLVVLFTCLKLNGSARLWVFPISSPCLSYHISLSSQPETVATLSTCVKMAFIFAVDGAPAQRSYCAA